MFNFFICGVILILYMLVLIGFVNEIVLFLYKVLDVKYVFIGYKKNMLY